MCWTFRISVQYSKGHEELKSVDIFLIAGGRSLQSLTKNWPWPRTPVPVPSYELKTAVFNHAI